MTNHDFADFAVATRDPAATPAPRSPPDIYRSIRSQGRCAETPRTVLVLSRHSVVERQPGALVMEQQLASPSTAGRGLAVVADGLKA